jgi:branched-chain amino acid transport system ATP-binding protein
MSDADLLKAEGITVGYGGAPIVRNVTFAVGPGQINCVVGPNGAGKSTALKAVAGVLRPTNGRITFDGSDVTQLSTDARVVRGLGYVPQVANVFTTLTVLENLHIGAHAKRHGIKARVESICSLFPDLSSALSRPAGTLSGGQRSMLALSRALMGEPKLLLLDEPTSGLAPQLEDQVWQHILAIQSRGIGVLIVEQNTRRALTNSDSAYVMVDGEVAAQGKAADLLERPDLVEMYLGGS